MKKMLAALCAAVMAACAMAAPVFAEGENGDIYNRDRMASDRDRGFKNALPVYALGDDLSLYEKGDVNLDGEVNVKDANLIMTEYNLYTLISACHILDENQRSLADLDKRVLDKKGDPIDICDTIMVLIYGNYRRIGFDVTVDEFLAIWDEDAGKILANLEEKGAS